MSIAIRAATTIEECLAVERLTAEIWGGGDVAVPAHLLITIAKNRGVVLLAWDDARPIGFCFCFPSYTAERRLKQCSHMAGVLPAYRDARIGEQLKWAQRAAVLADQIDLITWTFDPLETRNSRLNIHKLGAVCNTYLRNLYGDMADALNHGVPSDRFQVDWHLASARVLGCLAGDRPNWAQTAGAAPLLNHAPRGHSYLRPGAPDETVWGAEWLRVVVPRNFQAIKAADLALAVAWREQTRDLFEQAFARGYTAVDLALAHDRCAYLLQHKWRPQ